MSDKENEEVSSLEDQERIAEAQNCKDCFDWHHICKVECCKTIILNIKSEAMTGKNNVLTISVPKLSYDEVRYYRLHDVQVTRGVLRFRKSRIIFAGGKYIYVHHCKLLDGVLCKGHPDDKPDVCKLLNADNPDVTFVGQSLAATYKVSDNCLFKYKKGGKK